MSGSDETTRMVSETSAGFVGATLNGIYQVRRLIAKGGMGEVYEGVTVSDVQSRVAIKIIRPELANDPNLQRMFKQEARALEQMSHPGLVQYRVFARDPDLNVHYIVMEFVDGPNLSAVLPTLEVDRQKLLNFTVRTAAAIAAAHELGRFHRDICPQNILLPKGALEQAKIIDFGIVKKTARGDETFFTTEGAFAGHLGYAAPEQFDNAEIGPWTDIYSMALTVLAVAARKPPDMGGNSILKAVKMRQSIPDLSPLPRELHLLFSRMLAPEPADRLHSMYEVLAAIDEIRSGSPIKGLGTNKPRIVRGSAPRKSSPLVPALGALGIGVAAGTAFWFWPFSSSQAPPPPAPVRQTQSDAASSKPSPPPEPPALPARDEVIRRVDAALAGMKCQWLKSNYPVTGYPARGQKMSVAVSGVSGSSDNVSETLQRAAELPTDSGLDVDTTAVWPVQPSACAVFDAIYPFREAASGEASVVVEQPMYTVGKDPDCGAGKLQQAEVKITMRIGDPPADFSLISVQPDGRMLQLISNRATFNQMRRRSSTIKSLGDNSYSMNLCSPTGLFGLMLLKGKGPFDLGLKSNDYGRAPDDLPDRFANFAKSNGWTAQMAWYQVADSSGAVPAGTSSP